ncbi:MAG TPA: adenylate/guanylate cyclase domain-containing protein [Candidatus Limnocylindria bacterium]|nr:adenylate/guanylate cyclase domain-containing protein [Candidatus Limnocylindria bacterium]
MPELPTGTVTFVFTDIEGSTRALTSLKEAWPEVLERHRSILRDAFVGRRGLELGTEGDSFFFAFPSAPAAVAGAVAAQRGLSAERWPDGAPIRVRMGLHSGEADASDGTYAGMEVHRAARIAAAGYGGQVLLSDATRGLVARSLPDGVTLRDLGAHRLRDLPAAERLWQLVIPGVSDTFAPLPTSAGTPNNVPTRRTRFLGREREIGEVRELLGRSRLLTLTGPGGTGKTRLSLEVATAAMADFADGVWFVELGAITEPELVPATIAQALGLPDRGGRSPIDRLVDHVGDRRVLLVLDNFEQVVDAAPLIGELLAGAPNLHVVVTSRSVLRLYGEQEYPVPPLGVPDPRHLPSSAALSQYEAVALFIDRATAVKPDFRVTNENAPAVAEICVRLDGLPLAIELAAARIRILTPQAMLSRLDRRLGLLSGAGARDVPARQQTLRGAIAWSHDMLDEPERSLFACISVFVGGVALASAERVCSSELNGDVLGVLASLVDKSLVRQVEGPAGEPRFAMLETIREFAMEQAVARGRWEEVRARHGQLFLDMAEAASPHLLGSDKREWLDRLEQEDDNLRAAIGWAIETGRTEVALRMVAALWRFWQMRGHLVEALERAQAALDLAGGDAEPRARADALSAAAGLAYWLGDAVGARAFYDEEIGLRRRLDDRRGLAEALYGQSFTFSITGVLDATTAELASTLADEALALFEELGDRDGVARCLWESANVAWAAGDSDEALPKVHRAREIFRAEDDEFMVGWSSYTAGICHLQRDVRRASAEDRAEASRWLGAALAVFTEAGDVSGYTLVLDAIALLALREGDRARAARLSGAVSSLERTSGTGLNAANREVLGFEPSELRGDGSLAAAWGEGERMTVPQALAYAREGLSSAATLSSVREGPGAERR